MDSKLMTERLEQLKEEFNSGQKMLAELEARETTLRQTLLRISGAMQVLEELLDKSASETEPERTDWAENASRMQAR